jgi:hypothetical protein
VSSTTHTLGAITCTAIVAKRRCTPVASQVEDVTDCCTCW